MSRWWAPGSPSPMWGLAPTNMFPSTQKDRANVLESRPDAPSTPLSKTPFHLHLRLSLSRLTLLLAHCFVFFISEPLYLSPPLSATLISGPLFPSSPLLAFASLSSLSAAASWCCSHFFLTWGSFQGLGECMALFVWHRHFIGFLLLWNRGTTFQIHQGPI